MNSLTLDAIRDCCEGAIPATMATCAADGTPNVTYLSQVEYVDREHLALSFQFFNTTRRNVLENPHARLLLIHPATAAMYRIDVQYLRTETQGPLFERMRAKLAGIASHVGMSGVFKLRGADVYRVLGIDTVPGAPLPLPPQPRSRLSALRRAGERLGAARDAAAAFDATLGALEQEFGIRHAMLLMLDARRGALYTVASQGYAISGIGAEIPLGHGVIGIAAASGTAIRVGFMTSEYAYGRAVRDTLAAGGADAMLETEIPFPGLAEPRSQLAVPIAVGGRVLGVLYLESDQDLRFSGDDEDAITSLALQLGLQLKVFEAAADNAATDDAPADGGSAAAPASPLRVRHFEENHSVFLGDDYLIKGVAGAILWTLLRDHAELGRRVFSNRELRVDPRVALPDISDNLEARLILLERRLAERDAGVRIRKVGRGRFRLEVTRPLELHHTPQG